MSLTSRERLRQLGRIDLSAWVEAAIGSELWSIQRRIGAGISKHRARVVVPSCNASGKTFLAARLALAFYDTYTPGTPDCPECKGPCRGGKVLTTSSKAEHLRDALWGEIRQANTQLAARGIVVPGVMSKGQVLRLEESPAHFMIGQSPNTAEGFQGFHAAHKLILGDEATSLDHEMQTAIAGNLASGDSRLLLIFNPTTDDTYAALEARSPRSEVIKITAWDTPGFTGEAMPDGANLTTPDWLEELADKGMGPGTYEWTTRVEANFWTQGDDTLISPEKYDMATMTPHVEGTRALGVDMASYGTDENVIAYRNGNALTRLDAFPSMRMDTFWETKVAEAVRRSSPAYLIYDADGVGAGVIGYAETVVAEHNREGGNVILLPFRGGVKVVDKFLNQRSAWLWALRRRFEAGTIALTLPRDDKLRSQAIDIRYSVTEAGDIRVEPKHHMKARGTTSPDRLDAAYYAFSMVEELPVPSRVVHTPIQDYAGVPDRSAGAMQRRDMAALRRRGQDTGQTPWGRLPEGALAWDDY